MTWDALLTYDNFFLAWRRIRNSPITTTKDRLGLKVFSQSLDVHINRLIGELAEGSYEPESPSILYLPKKSGRLRPFTLLHMRDRLIYQAIGNVLIHSTYEELKANADTKVFSPVLAGTDEDYIFYPSLGKRNDFEGQFLKFTKKQAELIESGKFTWVVQTDIASFYPSIDHSLLTQRLITNGWLDESLCEFLKKCLRVWSSDDLHSQVNKGLPIGYETSDLLGNLFLNDLDQTLKKQVWLRYVDDIRIFMTSKKEGEKLLNHLDVFFQKRGLNLQSAKSSVRELDDFYTKDWLQNLEQQQMLLSSIDRDVNSPNQMAQEQADTKLRELLIEVLGIKNWDGFNLDEKLELTEETSLFFALYRFREKNIQLRDLVLDLLISHPHRSYTIVQYLTLFEEDTVVVERLWALVNDESQHGQVRANCLRALYRLDDDAGRIIKTIKDWIVDSDLSLSFCAIELIQQYPDELDYFDLQNIIYTNIDAHLLYSIVSTRFMLLDSDDKKKDMISWCLNEDNYMLNSLGVYFLSTNIHLLPVFSGNTSDLALELIQDFKHKISIADVILNIRKLFNIQYDFSLNEAALLSLSQLNQLVINMILSIETNRDEYLRNLTEFLSKFSQLYQKFTHKEFSSLIKTSEMKDAFSHSKNGLMNLSDFRSSITFIGTKPALDYINTEKLHEGIALIISDALQEIESLPIDLPETPLEKGINSSELLTPMIFFSYSHYDEGKRHKLEMKLRYLETYGFAKLYSDREIPAGQVWSEELTEKLNSSIIVLFLITSNFMGSEFIKKEEMPRAIINYDDEKTVCVPILLEDCVWKLYPYKHLQALPKDAKPVTHWSRPDAAYKDIQEKIQAILEEVKSDTYIWRRLPPKP